jgi:hypothetical protein
MESLRKKARILMWLVTVPFVLLALLAIIQLWATLGNEKADWRILAFFAPTYIYIWAVWTVRQALKAIAAGAMFDAVVPRLLFRVGVALFAGAIFNVIAAPTAGILFKIYLPNMLDGSAVTLGVVGATLALLSQLLKQAVSMREELDGFV